MGDSSGERVVDARAEVSDDLTDILLYQIILLLSSFHEFLAITGTCRSWRDAISSFPPIYAFAFPPLHLKADIRYAHQHITGEYSLLSNYKWKLNDPMNSNLSLHRTAHRNTPSYMRFLGCSYGYLIFSCREHFLLVDVYTCIKVKPPKLPANRNCEIYCGFLMAPLNSPKSRLLLCSRKSMFLWKVGTTSWTESPFVGEAKFIYQIVLFKGQMFAMDSLYRLNTISLAPQLGMQEVTVLWREDVVVGSSNVPWLVVCGDMLLMVDVVEYFFQVFRLDFSAKPAKWVKLEKLENWAMFVSIGLRSPTFSCMNPERWGGKSNCIYISSLSSQDSDAPWIATELGQSIYSAAHRDSYIPEGARQEIESFWVLPSLVYGAGK
ncbi:uncharacterized protein LOC119280375 [Triticum dicoccoides]|uniref:uncharacterized protein LOC119280375 n=1 Tax=Triticum dicoccoides TaxID=85692 RepID=UPI00188E0299|nr:uncharacterized protein LOC119280375 [Triticum dicoccoides]